MANSRSKSFSSKSFSPLSDILSRFKSDEDNQDASLQSKHSLPSRFSQDKYISQEFQKYGYELAKELGDLKNTSLYIKLAKQTPRGLLETAKNFVKDAYQVKSKPRLFMWKLKNLRTTAKDKIKSHEGGK